MIPYPADGCKEVDYLPEGIFRGGFFGFVYLHPFDFR